MGTSDDRRFALASMRSQCLKEAGWRRDALRSRLVVARAALAAHDPVLAQAQLNLARPLGATGTAVDRVELFHTEALVHIALGDDPQALRAADRGLRILDDYRAALGAPELRATASGIGAELAFLGLRLALGSKQASAILDWSERLRASALRLPVVRPASDRKFAGPRGGATTSGCRQRDGSTGGIGTRDSRTKSDRRKRSPRDNRGPGSRTRCGAPRWTRPRRVRRRGRQAVRADARERDTRPARTRPQRDERARVAALRLRPARCRTPNGGPAGGEPPQCRDLGRGARDRAAVAVAPDDRRRAARDRPDRRLARLALGRPSRTARDRAHRQDRDRRGHPRRA